MDQAVDTGAQTADTGVRRQVLDGPDSRHWIQTTGTGRVRQHTLEFDNRYWTGQTTDTMRLRDRRRRGTEQQTPDVSGIADAGAQTTKIVCTGQTAEPDLRQPETQ